MEKRKNVEEISDDEIIECYVNGYNEGDEERKKEVINGAINYNNPGVYRVMLTSCVLSKEDFNLLKEKLYASKDSIEGFAENFYYILQTDSRRLNFPNGYEGIKK